VRTGHAAEAGLNVTPDLFGVRMPLCGLLP
jgi:hypothetical protein